MGLVSIIIINYNTFRTTCDCLASLFKFCGDLAIEVILVDNASVECDPSLFLNDFPQIKLVKSDKNLGFAGGNNLGLKFANGEYVLLLNSDTVFLKDCISPCIGFMNKYPNIGVISPKLLNPDLSYQKNARRSKNIKRELLDFLRPIVKVFPYKMYSQYFLNQYFKGDYNTECDWLCGAFFMTRSSIVAKLDNQKFDERYFMYGEDQLWCNQIKALGYSVQFIAECDIIHIGNASTDESKLSRLENLLIEREIDLYNTQRYSKIENIIFAFIIKAKSKIIKLITR